MYIIHFYLIKQNNYRKIECAMTKYLRSGVKNFKGFYIDNRIYTFDKYSLL